MQKSPRKPQKLVLNRETLRNLELVVGQATIPFTTRPVYTVDWCPTENVLACGSQ
jgi:hypothetical protein